MSPEPNSKIQRSSLNVNEPHNPPILFECQQTGSPTKKNLTIYYTFININNKKLPQENVIYRFFFTFFFDKFEDKKVIASQEEGATRFN